jgi:phage terminase large subunit-like protein
VRLHNPPGQSRADAFRKWPRARREAWLAGLSPDEAAALEYDWSFWARPKQMAPKERYLTWILVGGRGFGKSRCGAQWVIDRAENGKAGDRITIVGRTLTDAQGIQVEGDSGILAHSPPWFMPRWSPANNELLWPNGVKGLVFGATAPDAFRGWQSSAFWADEWCAWQHPDCLAQLLLGLRLGQAPQGIITTTPRPSKQLRELMERETTIVTTGTTHENLQNLAPTFAAEILSQYEGTTLGRQELYAEILDDAEGALWKRAQLDETRVTRHPKLLRVVVGVDPAGSNSAKSNQTGIVVAGLGDDKDYYVLKDGTISASATQWATHAASLYHAFGCDRLIAETNLGGDMVGSIIRVVDPTVAYRGIHASRSKIVRAEPIAALYEQGRVHHVGFFPELEDEMCTYDPMSPDKLRSKSTSPDRLDALVFALSDLHKNAKPSLTGLNFDKSPRRQNPYQGF